MKKYEAEIKIALIRYLIDKRDDSYIIASEAPVNQSENIVDILQISKDCCIAYEIKSDKDNYNRLEKQLLTNTSLFDYSYVVVPTSHYKNILKLLSSKVGILLFENGNIQVKRKAKRIIRLNKEMLSTLIWKSELINLMKILYNYTNSYLSKLGDFELRELLVKKCKTEQIKKFAYNFLYNKYLPKYEQFLNSVGKEIHVDDLPELEINNLHIS